MIITGIGSRETPKDILTLMFWLGEQFCGDGEVLRSGGAPGADQAFEAGYAACMSKGERFIQEHAEIYLPWKSFEADNRSWIEPKLTEPAEWTYEVAAEHHPRWQYLKQGAKKLHARNVHQIFGEDPYSGLSNCVICWTKDAKGEGGTGQALRIARASNTPVFDLCDQDQRDDLLSEYPTVRRAFEKLTS